MKLVETIKRVLALVIVVCFFLPLAQCSPRSSADGASASTDRPPDVLVPVKQVKFSSPYDAAILTLFGWPLVFVAVRRRARSRASRVVINVVEGLLAAASLYWLAETIALWGVIRYGGVILLLAFGTYLLCVAAALYMQWRAPPGNVSRA